MSVSKALVKVGRSISKHSPAILTAITVTGVFGTAVLAIEATPKAIYILDELKRKYNGGKIPVKEAFEKLAPVYGPAFASAIITSTCAIGSNRISSKRVAAVASLYSASEAALKTYQDKVMEKFGRTKEMTVRDDIAKEQIVANPVSNNAVMATGNGSTLFYDPLCGQYFYSDIEKVRKVVNLINKRIINEMWISLNEFYYEIGIRQIELGHSQGWNIDHLMDIDFSAQIADNDQPCLVLVYREMPRWYDAR